ncbi:hypothetical protein L9F63_009115 [Diploptera punctata]|uniref:Uncharacterized protein n=1 Tax=Diploptera punctata TaxID=6984 RepID=A0AAD8E1E0_DIPPU|nr:hypothetical protein L9F63_009115 [Diploptera punctata]
MQFMRQNTYKCEDGNTNILHSKMIAKIIVAFCIFQMAFGQEDPEQDIRDLIEKTNQEMEELIYPLVERMQAFGETFGEEERTLQQEYDDLKNELQDLSEQLGSGKSGVSICLKIALDDAYAIYEDRSKELSAFHTVEFNGINQVFEDISLVSEEEETLIEEAERSISDCKTLETQEELQECYNTILTSFDEMKTDIINRLNELYKLGEQTLKLSEEAQESFTAGNREFVKESSDTTREELTSCIQNL